MILIPSYGYHAVKQIESTNTILRQEFLRREDLLDRLRSDLYDSAIEVRDYLLHFDSQQADRRRSELESMRRQMTDAVQQYQTGLAPEERVTVRELQRDLTEYWNRLEPAFGWSSEGNRERAVAFLREEIFPRHKQLLQLANRIAAIDERQIRAGENNVAAVFVAFRRQIAAGALLIIAMGSGVAVFSIRRILHLEQTSELRYREVVQARRDLQRLSARLVAAQEGERRRLSGELHDQVGQYMSAVLVELGNVDAELPEACPGVRERLTNVRQLAETSVAAVRNMSLLLRPSMLDALGLIERELLRSYMGVAQTAANSLYSYQDPHLEMDFIQKHVALDARRLVLTSKEYDLLQLLVQNAGEVVTRRSLLMIVWGHGNEIRTRTLDVHVRRPRKKLGTYSRQYIETIFGIGYRFQPFRLTSRFPAAFQISSVVESA
jgi:Transcriptional regulatory protein, C terminal/Histidine kinase/Four helix bundle sensory module for signal transduction